MNNQGQYNKIEQTSNINVLSAMFSFATLLLLVLAQNPDWGNNRLIWWGSVGLFAVLFLLYSGGVIAVERNYTMWLAGFIGFSVLSAVWSVSVSLVLDVLKSLLVYMVITVFLRASIKTEKDIERLLKLMLISVTINLIWLLFTNADIFSQTGGQDEIIDRFGNEGAWNANRVGLLSATAMLIALCFRKRTKSAALRLVYMAVILLTILVVLLTGSRKALVMVAIGFCGFTFLTGKGKRIRAMMLIVAAVFILYYLVMEVPFFYSIIGWRMEGFWATLTGVGQTESSAVMREKLIADGLRAWRERPLLGYGLNGYRKVCQVGVNLYAHNNYVELLADLGVIGTAIYYGAYIYCLASLLKIKNKDSLTWMMIVTILILAVMDYGCVSYNLLFNHILFMMIFAWITIRKTQET